MLLVALRRFFLRLGLFLFLGFVVLLFLVFSGTRGLFFALRSPRRLLCDRLGLLPFLRRRALRRLCAHQQRAEVGPHRVARELREALGLLALVRHHGHRLAGRAVDHLQGDVHAALGLADLAFDPRGHAELTADRDAVPARGLDAEPR